ncbi:unnamed protein product [Amoebophrya sp. A25]|nr:unnamed protein product [Amoebophrya sp. A25]|eukprot:GSA25T00019253001.1
MADEGLEVEFEGDEGPRAPASGSPNTSSAPLTGTAGTGAAGGAASDDKPTEGASPGEGGANGSAAEGAPAGGGGRTSLGGANKVASGSTTAAAQNQETATSDTSAPSSASTSGWTTLFVTGIDPDEDEDIWKGKVSGYGGVSSDEIKVLNFPEGEEDTDKECTLSFPTPEAAEKCKTVLENKGLRIRLASGPPTGGTTVVKRSGGSRIDQPLDNLVQESKRRRPNEYEYGNGAGKGGNGKTGAWSGAGGYSNNAPYGQQQWGHQGNYQQPAWGQAPGGGGYGPVYSKSGAAAEGPYDMGKKGKGKDGKKGKSKEPAYLDPNLPQWLAMKNYGSEVDIQKGKNAALRKGREQFYEGKRGDKGLTQQDGKGASPALGPSKKRPDYVDAAAAIPQNHVDPESGAEIKRASNKAALYALPEEPVSKWHPDLPLDKQLVDYLNMKRHGNLNRYLVISGLPDRMMNCKTIRSEFDWILADGASAVLSIELHTMMSKDVAHLSMRDLQSAQQLKAFCDEKALQGQTAGLGGLNSIFASVRVAHAAPRKAGHTLWLGNLPVDYSDTPWFLGPLRKLLERFGPLAPQAEKKEKRPWWETEEDEAERLAQEKEAERLAQEEKAAGTASPGVKKVVLTAAKDIRNRLSPVKEPEPMPDEKKTGSEEAGADKKEGEKNEDGGHAGEKKEGEDKEKKTEEGEGEKKSDAAEKMKEATASADAEKKPEEAQKTEDGKPAETAKVPEKDGEAEKAKTETEKAEGADASVDAAKAEGAATEEKPSPAQPPKPPVYVSYVPLKNCCFVTFVNVADAVKARNHIYALALPSQHGICYLNVDFVEEEDNEEVEATTSVTASVLLNGTTSTSMVGSSKVVLPLGQAPGSVLGGLGGQQHLVTAGLGGASLAGAAAGSVAGSASLVFANGSVAGESIVETRRKRSRTPKRRDKTGVSKRDAKEAREERRARGDKKDRVKGEKKAKDGLAKTSSKAEKDRRDRTKDGKERDTDVGKKVDTSAKVVVVDASAAASKQDPSSSTSAGAKDAKQAAAEGAAPVSGSDSAAASGAQPTSTTLSLYKMSEFCCKVKATLVQGSSTKVNFETKKMEIDQRTKLEHLVTHQGKHTAKYSIFSVRAKDRADIPAFNDLVTYFSERNRVGLVQGTKSHFYLVPAKNDKFLDKLPFLDDASRAEASESAFLLIQLPAKPKAGDAGAGA